ncbi:MAG: TA system VapC family ribonuclease toxin [Myxococcota bacterium]
MKIVDVNVLLHAYNPSAPLHTEARSWLESALSGEESVALAWVVLLAFLRIATNPRAVTLPVSIERACETVDQLLGYPPVRIVQPGPEHWLRVRQLLLEVGSAGNLTTDTHLAAIALEHGATLVSYDNDFARFEQLRWERPA